MFIPVIGLVGRARVGKDTIVDYILSNYSIYTKVKLAQPIKDAVQVLYGFTSEQVEGSEKEIIDPKWNITPRQAMVQLTETMMGFMGHDFFTRRLFEQYKNTPIIISDIRYEHDIENIRSLGGITIKIERLNNPKHVFEDKIDNFKCDFTVYNNGTFVELYNQIDKVFNSLMDRYNDYII